MKDKLVKTHHKAAYYRSRRISLVCLIAVSASIMISVPTYFSVVSTQSEVELVSTYSEIDGSTSVETL
ncbi:MAG: hypothetical protein LUB56_01245 [Coprobacillus sp.]|nr:hypothetical protein [Coprobacillus sp.]